MDNNMNHNMNHNIPPSTPRQPNVNSRASQAIGRLQPGFSYMNPLYIPQQTIPSFAVNTPFQHVDNAARYSQIGPQNAFQAGFVGARRWEPGHSAHLSQYPINFSGYQSYRNTQPSPQFGVLQPVERINAYTRAVNYQPSTQLHNNQGPAFIDLTNEYTGVVNHWPNPQLNNNQGPVFIDLTSPTTGFAAGGVTPAVPLNRGKRRAEASEDAPSPKRFATDGHRIATSATALTAPAPRLVHPVTGQPILPPTPTPRTVNHAGRNAAMGTNNVSNSRSTNAAEPLETSRVYDNMASKRQDSGATSSSYHDVVQDSPPAQVLQQQLQGFTSTGLKLAPPLLQANLNAANAPKSTQTSSKSYNTVSTPAVSQKNTASLPQTQQRCRSKMASSNTDPVLLIPGDAPLLKERLQVPQAPPRPSVVVEIPILAGPLTKEQNSKALVEAVKAKMKKRGPAVGTNPDLDTAAHADFILAERKKWTEDWKVSSGYYQVVPVTYVAWQSVADRCT